MQKKELFKRYIVFILGLFISAMGVAITQKGALGVSPISSVAYVFSLRFPVLTLGNWLILWNCMLIVGQILVLRKRFQWIQLLQIPLSFLFGWFTDFGVWSIAGVDVSSYPMQLACVLVGTAVLGLGVSISVIANVIMNSGEAFVKAVSDVSHKAFGNVKICFDSSCVFLAVLLSLCMFSFHLEGIREGTILAAVLTGTFVKLFNRLLRKKIEAEILR